jgi:hypothetical protein
MTILARTAGFAVALTLAATPRIEAQSSSIRVTIAGGPHAGTYALERGQCDASTARSFPCSRRSWQA